MRLGVAWYPEQHPPERWADDVRRMRDAGLELVRLGEFAWTSLEPARGRFAWDWLDRAIGLAGDAGLGVVLGTPTAAPPVWLALERPEILAVGPDGVRRTYGSRRFTCPTAPAYREESRRIVGALVARYGGHPAIVGWQLDNEPGNHGSGHCWCEASEAAFRAWLARRYRTVEALNRAWGTVFWSGTYPALEAVQLPRPTAAAHNPSLLLAHRRFASDQLLEAVAEQRAIVAAGAPGLDLFCNVPAAGTAIDPRQLARDMGTATVNVYPGGQGGLDDGAFFLDLAREHTGRAWVMEHQPGPINWTPARDPATPGQVRLWGWRAALHGMEAVLFFSWRPARSGSEQFHSGLLRHDGSPDRALGEVARLAAELRAVDPVLLRRPAARVAVLWSVEDHWAIEMAPQHPELTHRTLVVAAHAAALRLGLEVDVVAPEGDLSRYAVVLAPALQLATPKRQAALRAALSAGALVVLGARSLVQDADACWLEEPIPGGFAASLGARVAEGHVPEPSVTVEPYGTPAGPWVDVLELLPDAAGGAHAPPRVLATFEGHLHGTGAIAAVRRGNLVYAGFTSTEAWTALLREELPAGLPRTEVPAACERFVRGGRVIVIDHRAVEVRGLPVEQGRARLG